MAVPQQLTARRGATERAVPIEAGVTAPAAVRLAFVDSLRALAALAVVFLHAFQIYGSHQALGLQSEVALREPGIRQLALLYDFVVLRLGAVAVQVFIVISGFSLMLPIARSHDGRLRGGVGTFIAGRARRILPPYYAALALTLLIIAAIPGMNRPADVYWDYALPALDAPTIVAHLLLIHNADGFWGSSFSKINPPFWSIAVEGQIYLLFPLLVLLRRVWGWLPTLLLALAYGLLPLFLPIPALPLSTSWFFGLFGLGMAAAHIAAGQQRQATLLRERLPWGILTALLGALLLGLFVAQRAAPAGLAAALSAKWVEDYVLGFAVGSLLVFGAIPRSTRRGVRGLVMRCLETPALVALGKFSYSIYLLHAPVLALVALAGRELALRAPAAYLIAICWGIPLTLLISYLFYLVAERPFMSARTRVPAGAVAPPRH